MDDKNVERQHRHIMVAFQVYLCLWGKKAREGFEDEEVFESAGCINRIEKRGGWVREIGQACFGDLGTLLPAHRVPVPAQPAVPHAWQNTLLPTPPTSSKFSSILTTV